METIIRTKEEQRVNKWSGGETTELYIYPPESSYEKRDFLFRISSATVKDERSQFTKLSEVRRKLLVLDGKLQLNHNQQMGKWLAPNEQEVFLGDWDTESVGLATDYNLMTRGGTDGEINVIHLSSEDKEDCVVYNKKKKRCFLLLYVWEGSIAVESSYDQALIGEKDIGIFCINESSAVNSFSISNNTKGQSRVIKTTVSL